MGGLKRRNKDNFVHYIAGYTKHRNDGGLAIDDNAAREYDVQDAGHLSTRKDAH